MECDEEGNNAISSDAKKILNVNTDTCLSHLFVAIILIYVLKCQKIKSHKGQGSVEGDGEA